jgi:hypothetical protein
MVKGAGIAEGGAYSWRIDQPDKTLDIGIPTFEKNVAEGKVADPSNLKGAPVVCVWKAGQNCPS